MEAKVIAICILITVAVIAIPVVGAIIYKLNESNHSSGQVNEGTTRLSVSFSTNATTLNEGDKIQLTAEVTTLNTSGQVTFKDGTTTLITVPFAQVGSIWRAQHIYQPSVGQHDWYTAAE